MEFNKLHLNRELIETTINDNLNGAEIIEKKEPPGQIVYKFKVSGQPDANLNIYYNHDGTTSLTYKTGKNHDFSLSIAQTIVKKCSLKEFKAESFYIKKIREDDFETVLDFLKTECGAEIKEPTKIAHGKQVKAKGKQGDILSFNMFDNGSLQIQGKPLLLHSQTIEILSELLPFKDVIQQQLKFYETNITSADILGELENRIPTAYLSIDDKLKSIISPSIALRKVDIELTDYSAFAYPSLRGLEGVLKQIFRDKGIIVRSEDNFGDYFIDKGIAIEIRKESKEIINCEKTCNCLIKLYSVYRSQRHALFHVDGLVSNTKIINRAEAEMLINLILNILEETFVSLNN